MAASYVRIVIMGNLGKDPELRYGNSGKAWTSLSVATSTRWKGEDGKYKEKVSWHKVMVYGIMAEACCKHLKKGSAVLVESDAMQYNNWVDNEDRKRQTAEIIASKTVFLYQGDYKRHWKNSSDKNEDNNGSQSDYSSDPGFSDDDIPF